MKYSVIIPVYNAEATLRRCVDSLLADSASDAEIILVNDGSTDKSLEICQTYSKKYGNIITINKTNDGAASARNTGLKVASGEYLLFVDSDDMVCAGYFSALSNTGDSDFVVFGMEKDDGRKRESVMPHDYCTGATYLIKTRDGGPCNKRFKREILTQFEISFPLDLSVGEDFIFCLRYALHCKTVQYIHQALYYYDVSQTGSLTRKYREDYIEQAISIYQYAFSEVERSNLKSEERTELNTLLDYNYCRTAFACATIPLKYKATNNLNVRRELQSIMTEFSSNMRPICRTSGSVHTAMRLCIKKRLWAVMYLIARLRK